MSSFQLFMGQVQSAREGLKLKVLQVIFDILMMYDKELLHHSPEIVRIFFIISSSFYVLTEGYRRRRS